MQDHPDKALAIERQQAWEQRYSAGNTGWDRGEASPALGHWLASNRPPTGRVLLPGCGNGYEAAWLARHGCEVTAVDIAAQPVRELRLQLHKLGLAAEVVQADLLQWQPAALPFDAIYEQTSICALEPDHWSAYEQRLYDWLKPGGLLFALFMQTGRPGGPPYDCPVPDMRLLFDSGRWDWASGEPLQVSHPNGFTEAGFMLTRRGHD